VPVELVSAAGCKRVIALSPKRIRYFINQFFLRRAIKLPVYIPGPVVMGFFTVIPPQKRNPAYSALLSAVLPGLGQLYNYQIIRGLIFVFVFIVFLPLVLPAVFLWAVAVYDAYHYAKKLNTDSSGKSTVP
jgi:TM2 domain-containing membrane protein YozV